MVFTQFTTGPGNCTNSITKSLSTLALFGDMDRRPEFATPIKRVLEADPISTIVALLLGFSIYRWNVNRGLVLSPCWVKVLTYGSEILVLSFISAVRLMKRMEDILFDGYKR